MILFALAHRPYGSNLSLCVLVALVSFTYPQFASADTDVVEFGDGSRMVGELKSMGRGKLAFKTDSTGTINIEWEDVRYVETDQNTQVEIIDGTRYFGRIRRAEAEFAIVVQTASGPVELPGRKVISMDPIEDSGFRSVDLSVSAGYNYTKASDVTQFNLGVDASHRTRKRILSASFASLISDSTNNELNQRQTLMTNYTRLRRNRWLNDGGISFDRNDELDLNLRTSLSAGFGRILTQSNHSLFVLKGGLKATREDKVDVDADVNSLESYALMTWEWFRYDSPELDWSTTLEIIPSLTESGRVRAEFDAKLRWEMLDDLYWQLEFYDSFDNQPQSETTPENDYGITTSLSYDF